jgi:hypothetical protein
LVFTTRAALPLERTFFAVAVAAVLVALQVFFL